MNSTSFSLVRRFASKWRDFLLPISLRDHFFFFRSSSFPPSSTISLWMINLCHFIAGSPNWGNCQPGFWVMMYSSSRTEALGFLGMSVCVVRVCTSRTLAIQFAFISLYSSQTLVRPGRKQLLLEGVASLFHTAPALPAVRRRRRWPPSWL